MKAKAILLVGLLLAASCSNLHLAENQQFPKEYKTWSWLPAYETQSRLNFTGSVGGPLALLLAHTMKEKGYVFLDNPENADFLIDLRSKMIDNTAYPLLHDNGHPPRKLSLTGSRRYYLMSIYDQQSDKPIWSNKVDETYRYPMPRSAKYNRFEETINKLNKLPKQGT